MNLMNFKRPQKTAIDITLGNNQGRAQETDASSPIKRMYEDRIEGISDIILNVLQSSMVGIVYALEAKDEYSSEHSERVSIMSERLAIALGLKPSEVKAVSLASSVHDIGKIGIPDSVLLAPRRLTDEEFAIMKKHPEIGAKIIEKTVDSEHMFIKDAFVVSDIQKRFIKMVGDGMLHHHERWDGKGYPDGLKGEEIPYISRIIAVCDSTDAMLSSRVYRKALSEEECKREIRKNAGVMYDPEVAIVFLDKWDEIVGDIYHSKASETDEDFLKNDVY